MLAFPKISAIDMLICIVLHWVLSITLPTTYSNLPLRLQVSRGNPRTMAIFFGSSRCSSKKSRQPFCSNWFACWDYGLKFRFTKWWPPNLQFGFPCLGNWNSPIPTVQWSIWSCILFIIGSYSVSETASGKGRNWKDNWGVNKIICQRMSYFILGDGNFHQFYLWCRVRKNVPINSWAE